MDFKNQFPVNPVNSSALRVVPRSIEPQQVNFYQKPVFSFRVQNCCADSIEVLADTELWVVDYPNDANRGFRTKLETETVIAANAQAVLRFQPVPKVSNPDINAGSFPLRVTFHVRCQGNVTSFEMVSPENCVRVDGYGGVTPVDSIGMGILPNQTFILTRNGGYDEFEIIMKDLFPVVVRVLLENADPNWRVETDDGINLTQNGQTVLRQTRAWTRIGLSISPPIGFPANQVSLIGTLIAQRCPVVGGGLGACLGVGGKLRAVIAESAEVVLSDLKVTIAKKDLVLTPGSEFYISGMLRNPFAYSLQYHGPAGAMSYRNGADASHYVRYESFTFDDLEPNQSASVLWKFKLTAAAPDGIYTIQPFFVSAVYFSDSTWNPIPPLFADINKGGPSQNQGVQIEVKRTP